MKFKLGFVSNSSTTSFCIYGVCFYENELLQYFSDWSTKAKLLLNNIDIKKTNNRELFEEFKKIYDFSELSLYSENDTLWVGRSYKSIKDDETGFQFKESVKTSLRRCFDIPDENFDFYQEEIET